MTFPNSIYVGRGTTSPQDTLDSANHTERHNDLQSEVIATQTYLGVTGSTDTSTVRGQLASLDTEVRAAKIDSITASAVAHTDPATATWNPTTRSLHLGVPRGAPATTASPVFTGVTTVSSDGISAAGALNLKASNGSASLSGDVTQGWKTTQALTGGSLASTAGITFATTLSGGGFSVSGGKVTISGAQGLEVTNSGGVTISGTTKLSGLASTSGFQRIVSGTDGTLHKSAKLPGVVGGHTSGPVTATGFTGVLSMELTNPSPSETLLVNAILNGNLTVTTSSAASRSGQLRMSLQGGTWAYSQVPVPLVATNMAGSVTATASASGMLTVAPGTRLVLTVEAQRSHTDVTVTSSQVVAYLVPVRYLE